MPERQHLMGHFVRRFLIEEMAADRNLSPNTQKSYRDTIRLLFGYIAEHHATDPVRVTTEQVDATVVRGFLAHLEHQRGNTTSTRNLRLTALHSLFRFIGRQAPELVEHATNYPRHPAAGALRCRPWRTSRSTKSMPCSLSSRLCSCAGPA